MTDETFKRLEAALRELVDTIKREDQRLLRIETLVEKMASAMGINPHG